MLQATVRHKIVLVLAALALLIALAGAPLAAPVFADCSNSGSSSCPG